MGVFESLRRLRLPGMILLLGFWSLAPLTGILQDTLARFQEPAAVESARIEAPSAAHEICHHHPEGCPKDCFCPKITTRGEPAAHADHDHPLLKEPLLVRCTEGSDLELPPALVAFWPVSLPESPDFSGTGMSVLPFRSQPPRDPFQDPPLTVPRA